MALQLRDMQTFVASLHLLSMFRDMGYKKWEVIPWVGK